MGYPSSRLPHLLTLRRLPPHRHLTHPLRRRYLSVWLVIASLMGHPTPSSPFRVQSNVTVGTLPSFMGCPSSRLPHLLTLHLRPRHPLTSPLRRWYLCVWLVIASLTGHPTPSSPLRVQSNVTVVTLPSSMGCPSSHLLHLLTLHLPPHRHLTHPLRRWYLSVWLVIASLTGHPTPSSPFRMQSNVTASPSDALPPSMCCPQCRHHLRRHQY